MPAVSVIATPVASRQGRGVETAQQIISENKLVSKYQCRFSNLVSFLEALNCGDADCLTSCHLRLFLIFVSFLEWPIFGLRGSRLGRWARRPMISSRDMKLVESAWGAVPDVAIGSFPQAARRTRRACFHAAGSPRFLPLGVVGQRPGVGDLVAAVQVSSDWHLGKVEQFDPIHRWPRPLTGGCPRCKNHLTLSCSVVELLHIHVIACRTIRSRHWSGDRLPSVYVDGRPDQKRRSLVNQEPDDVGDLRRFAGAT